MDDKITFIEKAIPKQELQALKDIIIFRDADGTYNIYGKYLISKDADGIYNVVVIGYHTEKKFYKLKNAVAWCSYDKRNLLKDCKRIHQLDQMIFSMDTEIQLHSKLVKKTQNTENKLIYLSKLTQEKAKKSNFSKELNYYLNEYQKYQTWLFDRKPDY